MAECCIPLKLCSPAGETVYAIGQYVDGAFQSTSHATYAAGTGFVDYTGNTSLLTECVDVQPDTHTLRIPQSEIVEGDPAAAAANTAVMQGYIDQALNAGMKGVYLPKGHVYFTTLRTYIPGAGSTPAGFGNINIYGCGRVHIGISTGSLPDNFLYGTVLESTLADATAALQVSGVGGSQPTRQTHLECFSLIYNGTGYAIDANYNPFFKMKEIAVRVDNPDGSALLFGNNWYAWYDDVHFIANDGVSNSDGVTFAPTIFHGLAFTFINSIIEGFQNNFHAVGGTSTGVSGVFERTAFQIPGDNAVWIENGLQTVSFDGAHFEPGSVVAPFRSMIRAENCLLVEITGTTQINAGNNNGAANDGAINLSNVATLKMDGVNVLRPGSEVIKVITPYAGGSHINVESVVIRNDIAAYNLPINLFTGSDMWVENVRVIGGQSTNYTLLDPAFNYRTVTNDVLV